MLDYGYRSKCCKAALRMGLKKVKRSNQKVRVWVCVSCGTKDVEIVTKEEALQLDKPKEWWDDEPDDGYDG
jgi:hypothetical protein